MKKNLFITTSLSLSLLSVMVLFSSAVTAVSPNQDASQALEIAPPVLNLSANPGEKIVAQISLRDISPGPLVVKGQVNDFVSGGEDGTPRILLEDGEPSPYSMKNWYGPLATLNLKSKQIENLTVTINVPKDAAPGGYYSVIRFTATPPDLNASGVSLSASLGALILMQVKGTATEGMGIEEFSVAKEVVDGKYTAGSFFENIPLTFVERLKNTGTIHEQPVGQISIKDMFGNLVATVNVNLENRNVLPGSIRRFEAPLDKSVVGDRIFFGRYTAELKMTYGTENKTMTKTLAFWVVPWKLVLGIVFGLIFLFLITRFALRRYADRVADRASYRRRRR